MMKEAIKLVMIIGAILIAAFASGCSGLGKSVKSVVSGKEEPRRVATPRFSEQENLRVVQEPRQYKRMNRERFEDESEVGAQAGSLWVMEGQGAYLFAQNQTRMVGDLLSINIEGGPKQQLQTKVRVITRLLERLDNPRGLASTSTPGAEPGAQAGPKPGAPATAPTPATEGQQPSAEASRAEPSFALQAVPTRIIEQLKDGSYRVRGMQPFMIGKREYKVIVTGIVRPEDFDDSGIDASKLLDSQFDIVSSRKGATL